jgi:probable rRNA maturation factor
MKPKINKIVAKINVLSKLKDLKFCKETTKEITKKIISYTNYKDFGVNIIYIGNNFMRKLNKKDRKIDKTTDILSYPLLESEEPGIIKKEETCFLNLGDIYISQPYILDHCKENNININEYLPMLIIHGILHCLNYDHETDDDNLVMKKIEDQFLLNYKNDFGFINVLKK